MLKNVESKGIEVTSHVELPTIIQSMGGVDVIDNLESTRTDAALSANMGRELNEKIEGSKAAIAENTQDIALLSNKAQDNADAIAENKVLITANDNAIKANTASIMANSGNITLLDERVKENEKQIQDSQLKDLIVNVEEYPPVSGRYRADATSTEIEQAVNQGRTAYIKFDNLVYNFVEMDSQRVAKFRWVDIRKEILGKRELNVNYNGDVEKVDLLYDGLTKTEFTDNSVKPKGGYNRALYEALPNVVYNENSGYYEVWKDDGGLTDVTEEQMAEIYNISLLVQNGMIINGAKTRAVIPISTSPREGGINNINFMFKNCENIEYIRLFYVGRTADIRYCVEAFTHCAILKKISPILRITTQTYNDVMFINCRNLQNIKLQLIFCNYNLSWSPLLSYDTIYFMAFNSDVRNAITIKLHEKVYNKLNGLATDAEYAESGHTKEEWMAVNQQAINEQISFAI